MRGAVALAAVVVAAGCSESAAIRTEPAQFTVRGRWQTPSLRYFVERENSPIGAVAFADAVARAAEVWNATEIVALQPTEDASEADLAIGWRRGHHGACEPFGPNADVAHAGPMKRGTFIHFDLGREWTENSVLGTALHELGHILGLGHSEAPEAVMSTDPKRPTALSWHDLAGLHSLYGDRLSMTTADGDFGIGGDGAMLRRVAPKSCGLCVFDTDGDGDDELLVWRRDATGHGALMVYHFAAGRKLSRTLGPFHGAVAPDADVHCVESSRGDRYLVCNFDNGNVVLRQFDKHGIPGQPTVPPAPELLERRANNTTGDFDGDGQDDVLVHGPAARN